MVSWKKQLRQSMAAAVADAIRATVPELSEQVSDDIYGIALVCGSGMTSIGLVANTTQHFHAQIDRWAGHDNVRSTSLEFDVAEWEFMDYTAFDSVSDQIRTLYNEMWDDPDATHYGPEELASILVESAQAALEMAPIRHLVDAVQPDLLSGLFFIEPYQTHEFDAMERVSAAVNSRSWHDRLRVELDILRASA